MICNKTYDPRRRKLEADDPRRDLPASHLPVNRRDGRSAGHIQQAEYHERVSICRTESHCPQHSYKTVHPMGCSNILNTEKNTTA